MIKPIKAWTVFFNYMGYTLFWTLQYRSFYNIAFLLLHFAFLPCSCIQLTPLINTLWLLHLPPEKKCMFTDIHGDLTMPCFSLISFQNPSFTSQAEQTRVPWGAFRCEDCYFCLLSVFNMTLWKYWYYWKESLFQLVLFCLDIIFVIWIEYIAMHIARNTSLSCYVNIHFTYHLFSIT